MAEDWTLVVAVGRQPWWRALLNVIEYLADEFRIGDIGDHAASAPKHGAVRLLGFTRQPSYSRPMARAPRDQIDYFKRVAQKARALEDAAPPHNLEEMFDRLDAIRAAHGRLAEPSLTDDEGDLPSHRSFLARVNALRHSGKIRT